LDHLKRKVDAGADYIVTQLFFSNADFLDFRDRCDLAGIRVPIIAGIMPIVSKKGMARMAELAAGARFPAKLLRAIDRAGDDPAAVEKVGIHYATEQCLDLLEHGVSGIHFYTLNQSAATREIYANLGLRDTDALSPRSADRGGCASLPRRERRRPPSEISLEGSPVPIILLYLVADLYWIEGPLRQRIERNKAFTKFSLRRALAGGWVATVNGEPLTRAQMDQAAAVHFFRQGKVAADLSPGALAIGRRVALWRLIEDTLIRQYAAGEEVQVSQEAVRQRVDEFKSQFPDAASLAARLEALGLDEASLTAELGPSRSASVSGSKPASPSRRRSPRMICGAGSMKMRRPIPEPRIRPWSGRGICFSARWLRTRPSARPASSTTRTLESGEVPFETLAADVSEDERTKRHGGDLGWFGRDRMPRDFADVAFGLRPGQRSGPFRTALGWHIVEVTDARPPARLDYEDLKPEIRAWLETERRRYAAQVLVNRLMAVAVVEVFPENFGPPPPAQ
jgi:hypothetical protein